MPVKINFKLREAYGSKGFTAKQFAKKCGINYYRFKRLENGQTKKGWTKEEKKTVSRLLRVPQKILFEG